MNQLIYTRKKSEQDRLFRWNSERTDYSVGILKGALFTIDSIDDT